MNDRTQKWAEDLWTSRPPSAWTSEDRLLLRVCGKRLDYFTPSRLRLPLLGFSLLSGQDPRTTVINSDSGRVLHIPLEALIEAAGSDAQMIGALQSQERSELAVAYAARGFLEMRALRRYIEPLILLLAAVSLDSESPYCGDIARTIRNLRRHDGSYGHFPPILDGGDLRAAFHLPVTALCVKTMQQTVMGDSSAVASYGHHSESKPVRGETPQALGY